MSARHTPNWDEVGPELLEALKACHHRVLVKGMIGDPRDETALAKARAVLAKVGGGLDA